MFLHPNYVFQFAFQLLQCIRSVENSSNKLEKYRISSNSFPPLIVVAAKIIQGNMVFCWINCSDTFTVRINCASDRKNFENSWPLASNLQ